MSAYSQQILRLRSFYLGDGLLNNFVHPNKGVELFDW